MLDNRLDYKFLYKVQLFLAYNWDLEKKNYELCNEVDKEKHIFKTMKYIKNKLVKYFNC